MRLERAHDTTAEESPIYVTEAFQTILQRSLDDIKAGRTEEMRPELL